MFSKKLHLFLPPYCIKGYSYHYVQLKGASRMALVYRTRLPMHETLETQVRYLSREDPLEEETANHSSILA